MILLTRPYEDSVLTAQILKQRNIESHIEPMINILPCSKALAEYEKAIKKADALIITSANALKVMTEAPICQFDLPLYTVGKATAKKAEEMGYTEVHYGGEDVMALNATLKLTFENCKMPPKLIYASGDVVSYDIESFLKQSNINVERVMLYNTEPAESFSEGMLALLKVHKLKGALFYSTRSAEIFIELAHKAACDQLFKTLPAYAISSRVAQALCNTDFATIKVARRPTQDALLELVG